MALFVAAPLLTAAALSLAGVVGGADDKFRWPGPILLLLVVASLSLIASIQLSYHSRLYLYSHGDLVNWLSEEYVEKKKDKLWQKQQDDQKEWKKYNSGAVHCFNAGTLLLGFGVAAALVPPACGRQAEWRTAAAVVVLIATVADAFWIVRLHNKVAQTSMRVRVRGIIFRWRSHAP